MRFLLVTLFSLGLTFRAHAQTLPATPKLPLNALIVSGGPTPAYNQYAIESNARYVEKLTAGATARRILFADGSKTTRTISTLQTAPDQIQQTVFAWLLNLPEPRIKTELLASTLGQIDGPATKDSVVQNIGWLAQQTVNGQKSLLYFTGHGAPGVKAGQVPDFQNTTDALWNNQKISVTEVADALKNWPSQAPLVVVMVQCYSGGFANLLFEGGDPKKPLLNRDFCGFFAATGERMASGCTSEVNETNYQDFTTHFFAALTGISRDGQKVTGADYDRSGAVSMLEALAWTNLNDASIDVPVCTSDAYLRNIFPQTQGETWAQTPYSALTKTASPWQKAMLEGLSVQLGLTGEGRVEAAMQKRAVAQQDMKMDAAYPPSIENQAIQSLYNELKSDLQTRFPDLKTAPRSKSFREARAQAIGYLATRKADVDQLGQSLKAWQHTRDSASTREAQAWRFVRATRTLFLEARLQREGTPEQKTAFARLRAAENTNPLR